MKKSSQVKFRLLMTLIILGLCAVSVAAQTTAFTYQGKLTNAGNPANGQFDFQFKLFDTQPVGTGTQQGGDVNEANVTVTNGSFSVQLDFGVCASCFNGAVRFLEIAVKPTGGGTFTALGPRQPITSTPYAIRSQNATTATMADGLSVACFNCVTSTQIASVNGNVVSGTIPVASVPAGSSNYIQNTTSQQATSNFNISGNGTAGGILSGSQVNAATHFNLGGLRVLSATGVENLFAGINAGTTGIGNSFFGSSAGQANTSGFDNAFFGFRAGVSNTTGSLNAFFGREAGSANTTGGQNAFFGLGAGMSNTTSNNNTFIGDGADFTASNPTGNNNTLLGFQARVNSGISNATAIGAFARVDTSDSLVLGNGFANVGIGTSAPLAKLDIRGDLALDPGSSPTLYTSVAGTEQNRYLHLINSPSAPSASGLKAGGILVADDYGYSSPGKNNLIVKGTVGIGTNVPDQLLSVNGNASKLGGGSWATFSDERLKTIHGAYTRGLHALMQLQPIRFAYKSDNALGLRGTGEYIGFSAQAVERILPEAVIHSASGYLQINNDPILWSMLNAVKEQQGQIETQQVQIHQYQNQLADQQTRITEQEAKLARQQRELDALKQLLCQAYPRAEVCRASRSSR